MNQMLRKSAIALAVAAAAGATGQALALGTIMFDRDGTGGATGAVMVDSFQWNGDSILMQNLITDKTKVQGPVTSTTQTFGDFTLFMQSRLADFVADQFLNAGAALCTPDGGGGSSCNPITGSAFTFTLKVPLTVTTASTTTTSTTLNWNGGTDGLPITGSEFTIYYQASPTSNQLAGTGFNAGLAILTGKVVADAATNGNFTMNQDANNLFRYDAHNGDNYPTIGTYNGNGSTQFDIQVQSQNTDFFKSNLLNTVINVGLNLTTAVNTPFLNVDPSAAVFGQTPFFGNDSQTGIFQGGTPVDGPLNPRTNETRIMDDLTCGVTKDGGGNPINNGTTVCDMTAQGQGQDSFFNPVNVPEPGSLALLGIGFGLLGYFGRRQSRIRQI